MNLRRPHNNLLRRDWIAQARAVRIDDEIARRRIKLKGRGPERCGPCPKCGGTDRFAINTNKQIWNCRGCQRGGDVISLVQHLDGCTFDAAVATLSRHDPTGSGNGKNAAPDLRNRVSKTHRRSSCNSDVERAREALAIWSAARDPQGTPAWTYLLRRGVALEALPSRINEALRFHPDCPWHDQRRMCVVALWTDTISGEARAIHRRPITPDGENLEHWRAWGPTTGCVIRLWPDDEVSDLVLGEGVETVLAAATRIAHRGTLLQPAWAAGDAGHIGAFPVLSGVEALTLLVDADENGIGQCRAAECARRWTAEGREVIRLTPRLVGADFNDLIEVGS
jgi:CHC2 zinc finger/Toprim domain